MTGRTLLHQQSQSLSIVVFTPSPAQLLQTTTLAPPGDSHPGRLYGGREDREVEEKEIFIIVPLLSLLLSLINTVSPNPQDCLLRLLSELKVLQVPQFLAGSNTTLSQPNTQCGDGDNLGRTLLRTP